MDLMKTVTETSQNTPDAKEQLHRLNEQKKLDLENSLLKEALAESSGRFERSLKELKDLQEKSAEQDHQTIEAIRESVEQLLADREILGREMSKEIGNLRADLQKETINKVESIWRDYQLGIEQTFTSIIRKEELANDRLKKQADEVEQARHRLFRFDGVKHVLFWIGMAANIITCVILLLERIMN